MSPNGNDFSVYDGDWQTIHHRPHFPDHFCISGKSLRFPREGVSPHFNALPGNPLQILCNPVDNGIDLG